jgi:hypothetical protein
LWTTTNPFPSQELEPTYVWGNTINGNPAGVTIHNCPGSCAHIKEGRDYLLFAKPGYTPFTYPHPLTQEAGSPPSSPTNLVVQ